MKNNVLCFCCSRERMSRLLLPFADQHIEIPSLSAGNIALTVGLKQVNFHGTKKTVLFTWSFEPLWDENTHVTSLKVSYSIRMVLWFKTEIAATISGTTLM